MGDALGAGLALGAGPGEAMVVAGVVPGTAVAGTVDATDAAGDAEVTVDGAGPWVVIADVDRGRGDGVTRPPVVGSLVPDEADGAAVVDGALEAAAVGDGVGRGEGVPPPVRQAVRNTTAATASATWRDDRRARPRVRTIRIRGPLRASVRRPATTCTHPRTRRRHGCRRPAPGGRDSSTGT